MLRSLQFDTRILGITASWIIGCSKAIGYLEEKKVKKILVIEELAETRNFFLESLKAEGFDTIGAENARIAIERVQEELPDLIISETITPKLDGYGVLSTLRQNPITAIIPFIFVTARKTWTDIRKAMELGADDYLTKPCTIEELLRAIATRLEKQSTLKQWYAVERQKAPEKSTHNTTAQAEINQLIHPAGSPMGEVFKFIEANYQQPISLTEVAQAVGYAPAYLTDLMRRQSGKTVHQWIVERRMTAACSLLLETNRSVEEIATAVGYSYTGCFFRQFRLSFEMTPKAWRKTQLERQSGNG